MQQQFAIPTLSKTMKIFLITFVAIWIVLQLIGEKLFNLPVIEYLGLTPGLVLNHGFIWQLMTYVFLHSYEVSHILLNLLMTWFLGSELERLWGPKKFWFYFFGTGIGAGAIYTICILVWHSLAGGSQGLVIPIIGASGSVFGLLVAYGLLFGERTIHFMLLFPMKAKVFVLILGGVEVLSLLSHGIAGSGVANLAHLGGLISGFLLLVTIARLQKRQKQAGSQRKKGLHLVVDNEKDSNTKTRYWN